MTDGQIIKGGAGCVEGKRAIRLQRQSSNGAIERIGQLVIAIWIRIVGGHRTRSSRPLIDSCRIVNCDRRLVSATTRQGKSSATGSRNTEKTVKEDVVARVVILAVLQGILIAAERLRRASRSLGSPINTLNDFRDRIEATLGRTRLSGRRLSVFSSLGLTGILLRSGLFLAGLARLVAFFDQHFQPGLARTRLGCRQGFSLTSDCLSHLTILGILGRLACSERIAAGLASAFRFLPRGCHGHLDALLRLARKMF